MGKTKNVTELNPEGLASGTSPVRNIAHTTHFRTYRKNLVATTPTDIETLIGEALQTNVVGLIIKNGGIGDLFYQSDGTDADATTTYGLSSNEVLPVEGIKATLDNISLFRTGGGSFNVEIIQVTLIP